MPRILQDKKKWRSEQQTCQGITLERFSANGIQIGLGTNEKFRNILISNALQEQKGINLYSQFLNFLKEIRKKMAYYFCFGRQDTLPYYFTNNMSYYPSFQILTNTLPFQNTSSTPAAQNQSSSQAQKSAQELQTIVSEEPVQNVGEAVKNRRKRQRNVDRELVSAKKNSESNIINHFFTYFTLKECSETVVRRAIRSLGRKEIDVEKVMTIIYNIIRVINLKRGRKYINKAILCSYFTEEYICAEIDNIKQQTLLSISEIALVLRKCLYNFVNQVSLTSVLTSKRITTLSKKVHLDKRRKVLSFIHCKSDQ